MYIHISVHMCMCLPACVCVCVCVCVCAYICVGQVGREGLPRRLSMLRSDAVDFRTHSFEPRVFRLSRVGALEFSPDVSEGKEGVAGR